LEVESEEEDDILSINVREKVSKKVSLNCEYIDIVYTWVNGSDPEWSKQRQIAEKKYGIPYQGPWRYRDVMGLRYSMRSVRKHLPWVRHIFVVSAGQYPSWYNQTTLFEETGVSFIFHDELFVNKSHLPTFQSSAIESNFYNLPERVSDCFIYMNDDIFYGNDVPMDDLYSPVKGQPLYYTGWLAPVDIETQKKNPFHACHAFTNDLMNSIWGVARRKYFSHGPSLMNKRMMKLIHDTFPAALNNDSSMPFRHNQMVSCHFTYIHFANRFVVSYTGDEKLNYYGEIRDYVGHMEKLTADIMAKRPKFVCLNDGLPQRFNQSAVDTLEVMFETLFPEKGSWEL
ncbi:hypothetical protein SAMD00019534_107150, partial [Acytostelium subglobosum LB1]|uniref:hypothetical protein n=1 Tax=Acytostelium subglobosum LB1 TaxID=1410327 RepID=UPI000644D59D